MTLQRFLSSESMRTLSREGEFQASGVWAVDSGLLGLPRRGNCPNLEGDPSFLNDSCGNGRIRLVLKDREVGHQDRDIKISGFMGSIDSVVSLRVDSARFAVS